ncbi:MocR-like pyridoxine biosynthesis transcription factor PdxR [Aneurinibacillus migulanus]|uniref:Transcriptional regulator n=1 Tax=Aneurinibacillus migulanus TaxID=47500 RepID=A0A0D1Y0I2_ANEMI|nr:PLP-dependent aminotransferase family protein [Aneurinibacillus migulanus]KIV57843.1 transcriptional regulator [Aneurinibacillus migulanus]KON97401.1 transcriptional regulator [Aneurinibacillus migulanus]MED0896000.1 PLP-dependent aminotransferase family protein [Aneurinibacillus migulanus]MED1616674.1 PLP-dependent aminotransferase family protein [Aneurinibacillus migulanus]SDI98900.1 GntR family transcriptional regulator / MocR family aminotransferase [Aneurinibacillus migulanus]
MREFSLNLSLSKKPIFFQIYSYFKNEILNGQLQYNDFLPSIRSCAQSFKVSKNTVEVAYQLLVSEEYIHNIPKRGYKVVYQGKTKLHHDIAISDTSLTQAIRYDFRYGNIELNTFPFHQWNKVRNACIAHNQRNYMVEGKSQGEYGLRKELSRLLYESKGVLSNPEQIVVGSTPQQLVSLLCQILEIDKHIIGVENPGYDGARNTFLNYGFQVQPIPLTKDGVSIDELENSHANVMYVSPSQQFMNKMNMSQNKRQELVTWVHSHTYIIEDDYEWEFKYQNDYLPSIQSLYPEKTIYIGRFSKALVPIFNLSYLVLPYDVLSLFYSKVTEYDQPVSRLDQLTFSQYLSDGYWYKQLQKMRETYEEKRKIFFEAISQYMRHVVKAEGKDMGLHTFLTVKTDKTEAELIGLGVQKGVKVYGTSRYWFHTKEKYPTVLLGYGALSPSEIHNGIKLLAEAWFG